MTIETQLPIVTVAMDGSPAVPMGVKARKFSTGSVGYYVWGKITHHNGKRYQVSMNLVEIGSKNRNKDDEE